MEDVRAADSFPIRNGPANEEDKVILSRYLMLMIFYGISWPEYFIEDVNVFNKDPSELFDTQSPVLVIVNPRTEACGKIDGCESGCWRIMGRDKIIKSETFGIILGFKKILKFCAKNKPRECKRSWVMEEYRLAKKWNWKQDTVVCKIRLLLEAEINFLLAKQFSHVFTRSKPYQLSDSSADED